jgi:hypothetical protein
LLAITSNVAAYLDTCIVSGLAKGDLSDVELDALVKILEARKRNRIDLVTSEVTKREIAQIPDKHRRLHQVVYILLDDVPAVAAHRTYSALMPMGVGGGRRRQDPLMTQLKGLLPDVADAEHVFQAAKNGVEYFVTVDQRSIVRHAEAVRALCGVKVVTPTTLVQLVDGQASAQRDG